MGTVMSNSSALRLRLATLRVLEALMEDPTGPAYGFELMARAGLKSGTTYPILARLEREGWLESAWEEGAAGTLGRPRRRYYVLTAAGLTFAAEAFREQERQNGSMKRRPKVHLPTPGLSLR